LTATANYTLKTASFGVYFARARTVRELLMFKRIEVFGVEIGAITRYMQSFRKIGRSDLSGKMLNT